MPVVKVPYQHRFGVISQAQKVKLQEEVLQEIAEEQSRKEQIKFDDPVSKCESYVSEIRLIQSRLDEIKTQKEKSKSSRASTAISALSVPLSSDSEQLPGEEKRASSALHDNADDTSLAEINDPTSLDNLELSLEKDSLNEQLKSVLKQVQIAIERAKRRSGLSTKGQGDFVNLTLSWTELTVLNRIQCNKVKRQCLEILAGSLSAAPLTSDRIVFAGRLQALVFVAQSLLFWLSGSIESNLSQLTIEEFISLRVLYFIFLRIWTYVTLGILTNERHHSNLESILKYVSAIDRGLELYRDYPDACYCVKVILEVSDELRRITVSNHCYTTNSLSATKAVAMDEILIDDINIDAKLIRDIAPSLYQSIDLFRRRHHEISTDDLNLLRKSLGINYAPEQFPLMDKLFTLGILAWISSRKIDSLEIFQENLSGDQFGHRDWTEQYLSTQSLGLITLYGRTSTIKRSAFVTKQREQEEATRLCDQSWRPKPHMANLGGLIDMMSFDVGDTAWIVNSTALCSLINIEHKFDKSDPLQKACFNLIQANYSLAQSGKLNSKIVNCLELASAIRDEQNLNIAVNDLDIWERCAELLSETLLPSISLSKSLRENKILEIASTEQFRKPMYFATNKKRVEVDQSTVLGKKDKRRSPVKTKTKLFTDREDKKLQDMVRSVWDDQLYQELEKEIER